jgi:hypothetical protein
MVVPPGGGVTFATAVVVLWHLRRLRAVIGLVEVGSARETVAWVVEEEDPRARRSECS